MNIASFCFAGFAGTNQALRNLHRTVRLSRHFSVTTNQLPSVEWDFFANYFSELAPELLILGAWTPAYQRVIDALPPKTAIGIYWTSSAGQVDISQEATQLVEILQHPRIRYLFFSSDVLAAAFPANERALYLPSLFPPTTRPRPPRAPHIPVLSLFCSPKEYRRKNILNTLIAVSRQKHETILYLNGLSEDAAYRALLTEFKIQYQDFGWLNRSEYEKVLAQIDIGLQASFSESFGYVVTDHLLRGIPVLVSRSVPAMHHMPRRVQEHLILENPDDPIEFGNKLDFLLTHPRARHSLAAAARRQLLRENEANIQTARATLRRIVAR